MKAGRYILLIVLALFSAKAVAQQTDDADSRVTQAYLNGVWALDVERDAVKAGLSFAAVLAIDSLHAPTHYQLAGMLSDNNKALVHIKKAVEIDPENVEYLERLSAVYFQAGDYDNSIAAAQRIIEVDESVPRSYYYLISVQTLAQRYNDALSTVGTVRARFGDSEEMDDYRFQLINYMPATEELVDTLLVLVSESPRNVGLLVLLGHKYEDMGEDSLAMENYLAAQEIDPTDIRVVISLFEVYNNNGEYEKVFETVGPILSSEDIPLPSKLDLFARVLLSDSYYFENHASELKGYAKNLRAMYPDEYNVLLLDVQLLAMEDDRRGVLDAYYYAQQRGMGGFDPYDRIIQLEYMFGNKEKAIEYADMAMVAFPEERASMQITKIFLMTDGFSTEEKVDRLLGEAKETYDKIYRSQLYCTVGDIYMEAKEGKKAEKYYKLSLKDDPDNIYALNNYAYELSERGKKLPKALEMIEKVIAREPNSPTYLDTHGWVLYKMGRYDEAKAVMGKAVSLDTTNNDTLLMHYGDILDKAGQRFMAETYWKKSLEAGADGSEIRKRLNK